jgi:hypothetical protein
MGPRSFPTPPAPPRASPQAHEPHRGAGRAEEQQGGGGQAQARPPLLAASALGGRARQVTLHRHLQRRPPAVRDGRATVGCWPDLPERLPGPHAMMGCPFEWRDEWWETRPRGGRYYTRSRKVAGRVVREYVGGGLLGELAAEHDAEARAQRARRAAARRAERQRLADLDAPLARLCALADGLARGALLLAGYRRHHRGEWRKARAQ